MLESHTHRAFATEEGVDSRKTGGPLFTIAIATYNRADLIRRCIDSCLGQSFGSFEVVVVDGASTDNSAAVIQEVQYLDSRVKLVVQSENVGISAGRYDAVMHARGVWVLQVDSDHMLKPCALAVLKVAIDELADDAVGAVCGRYRWDTGSVTPKFVAKGVVGYEDRMRWVEEEGGTDTLFCARRTALLESNWFCDRRASMDALFHLNFSRKARQIYLDNELALQFATMGNSSSRGHRARARMLRKWAPDMAWQYEEIIRLHGAAMALHAPHTLRRSRRQAALQYFYAGNRVAGIRAGWIYICHVPMDVGFWCIFVVGAITPALVPLLNEWRHFVRNIIKI